MRVSVSFQGKHGQVALDHLRAVPHHRLVRRLGAVSPQTAAAVSATLIEMFSRP
jgi:mRNA interferase MazF